MREVQIPGGTARFREQGVDPIPGNSIKLIRAAATAVASQFPDNPELFEGPRPGESDEQRNERVQKSVEGMAVSLEQAMCWDSLREATAVALLKEWTLPLPLPTIRTIGDEEYAEVYEALLEAVGGMSAADLEVDFSPRPLDERESPTTGSGDSPGPSEAAPANQWTTTPGNAGSPTSGASSSLVPS